MLITSPRTWRDCTDTGSIRVISRRSKDVRVDTGSGQTTVAFIVADLPLALEQAKPCKGGAVTTKTSPGSTVLIPSVWMCTVTAASTTPSRSQHQADISACLNVGGVEFTTASEARLTPDEDAALRYTLSYADPATYAGWSAPRTYVGLTKLGSAPHELRSITDCQPRGGVGTVGDDRTGAARRFRVIHTLSG